MEIHCVASSPGLSGGHTACSSACRLCGVTSRLRKLPALRGALGLPDAGVPHSLSPAAAGTEPAAPAPCRASRALWPLGLSGRGLSPGSGPWARGTLGLWAPVFGPAFPSCEVRLGQVGASPTHAELLVTCPLMPQLWGGSRVSLFCRSQAMLLGLFYRTFCADTRSAGRSRTEATGQCGYRALDMWLVTEGPTFTFSLVLINLRVSVWEMDTILDSTGG